MTHIRIAIPFLYSTVTLNIVCVCLPALNCWTFWWKCLSYDSTLFKYFTFYPLRLWMLSGLYVYVCNVYVWADFKISFALCTEKKDKQHIVVILLKYMTQQQMRLFNDETFSPIYRVFETVTTPEHQAPGNSCWQ